MRKRTLFQTIQDVFQPDKQFQHPNQQQYELDQQFLAFLVGCVAIGLPVVMIIAAWQWTCFYDSISHFYYAPFFGDVFVAILVFIGTFLIAYRGESHRESLLATWAGLAAFGVALMPTSQAGCGAKEFSSRIFVEIKKGGNGEIPFKIINENTNSFFELFPVSDLIHQISALLLFSFLAFYSFFIFTRVKPEIHKIGKNTLTKVKKTRNQLYITSGCIILVCILALLTKAIFFSPNALWEWWTRNNLTFIFETFALWAFGFSWLVKGRFWRNWLADIDPKL